MANAKITPDRANDGLMIDGVKVLGKQVEAITHITDSTGGSAGDEVNDTTASVKDDIATLAAKINAILDALEEHGLLAAPSEE